MVIFDFEKRLTIEEIDAFLSDLTAVSRKHGIVIDGCGCCHSPSCERLSQDAIRGEYEFGGDGGGNRDIWWKVEGMGE